MPANINSNNDSDALNAGTFFHIYNKGVEGKVIFKDESDCGVFLGYLQEYLTPHNPENYKKQFVVNGREFSGITHQPKNYFGRIELLLYSLNPNHFHLVVKEIESGSVENFMRSLSTRYSIYFNKKYARRGSLFAGPYRTAFIKDINELKLLSHRLHQNEGRTSLPDYLGTRTTPWLKSEVITSLLKNSGLGYQEFLEKYQLSDEEKIILRKIVIDDDTDHNINPTHTDTNEILIPQTNTGHGSKLQPKPKPRVPEYFSLSAVFVILTSIGLFNINNYSYPTGGLKVEMPSLPKVLSMSTSQDDQPPVADTQLPADLSADKKAVETSSPVVLPKPSNTIKINRVRVAGSGGAINIYNAPTPFSPVVKQAVDNELFNVASHTGNWYGVVLYNGSTGYISSVYIKVVQ